jgi:sugar/nucleoside kinase (ribokinase family)
MEELLQLSKQRKTTYSCGGSWPNTIITLASLGVPATYAGKIGNDENGTMYRNRLTSLGAG